MKIPNYMRQPMNNVCHARSAVGKVRRAIELGAKLQRKAGAPRETILTFAHMSEALKKVENGMPLADALKLGRCAADAKFTKRP